MLVNMFFPTYMAGKWNNETITKRSGLGYFSASQHRDKITVSLDVAMTFSMAFCVWNTWPCPETPWFFYITGTSRGSNASTATISPREPPVRPWDQRHRKHPCFGDQVCIVLCCFFHPLCLPAVFENSSCWWVNVAVLITVSFPVLALLSSWTITLLYSGCTVLWKKYIIPSCHQGNMNCLPPVQSLMNWDLKEC